MAFPYELAISGVLSLAKLLADMTGLIARKATQVEINAKWAEMQDVVRTGMEGHDLLQEQEQETRDSGE